MSRCNDYPAVGYRARDFVGYFNLRTIGIGSFFSASSVFFCPSFFCYASFFALITSPPHFSSLAATPSSVQPPMAPKPGAPTTSPRGPVTTLLLERLLRWDGEFAELDETFYARENRVLKLELFSVKSVSNEATLRSQMSAL